MGNKNKSKVKVLLSTDTLSGYGLDLIFDLAKKVGFDGIDLATWKNFDAWNIEYVKKLSESHKLDVKIIQLSSNINKKELDLALDLCEAVGADTITINPPKIMDFKPYNFLGDNLSDYRKANPDIKFSIINPEDSNLFALPIPKYHYNNIVEIIKKHGCYLGFDVSNLDEDDLENNFLNNIDQFLPYMSVLYLSDKTKLGKGHVIPGEGVLKLKKILKKIKENDYDNYISFKINIDKKDLVDPEKTVIILEKLIKYYKENYKDLDID